MKKDGRKKRKPSYYWNFEKCRKEALKYKQKSHFKYQSAGAFNYARKNNILNKICYHMKQKIRIPVTYWTFKKVKEESLKYKTKTEFLRKAHGAYMYAKNNNYLNKLCKNMRSKGKWTPEELFSIAAQYKTIKAFRENRIDAHNYAYRTGLINHKKMKHLKRVERWTLKEIMKESKKFKYRKVFQNKSKGAYLAAFRLNILDKICSHMIYQKRHNITKKMVLARAKEFSRRTDFQKKDSVFYTKARLGGYLNEACKHMKTFKENQAALAKWNKDTVSKEALKYKTRTQFQKKASGAYDFAYNNKIMNEVCKHMLPKPKKWNYETCKQEALKYSERIDLKNNCANCLRTIYFNGWTNLLNHMVSKNYQIELKMLHPKIKKILIQNKTNHINNIRLLKLRNIPDFIINHKNYLIVIEAKSDGTRQDSQKSIDNQVRNQIKELSKKFRNKKIVHILLSEYGATRCLISDYNFSLKDLKLFLIFIKKQSPLYFVQAPANQLLIKKLQKKYKKFIRSKLQNKNINK